MKDKQNRGSPIFTGLPCIYCYEIIKKIHLIFPDQTKRKKKQLRLFGSAALTETVMAELVLSSL